MNEGLRSGKMALYGTVLMLSWSLMPMMSPVAYSQPLEPVPVEPVVPPPTTAPPATQPPTPAEVERAKEADRAREAERLKQSGQTTDRTRAVEPETRVEKKKIRPHETYVAGFGGYTFGASLDNIETTGLLPGNNLGDRDLADAGIFGGKVGHFFGGRMDWLGVEVEGFHTSPHVEQVGFVPGTHFTVTTLAFNLIGRLKLACETKTDHVDTRTERAGTRTDTRTDTRTGDYTYSERKDPNTGEVYTERKDVRTGELSAERKDPVTGEVYTEYRDPKMGELYRERKDPKTGQVYTERRDPRTGQLVRTEKTEKDVRTADREVRYETRYERDFCRLQPYAGVGLGLFWADLGNNGNSASDSAAPGLNALAGVKYFFTEHVALFGEYKYNYAPLDFSGGPFGGQGIKTDYSANHIVGGLSFHF